MSFKLVTEGSCIFHIFFLLSGSWPFSLNSFFIIAFWFGQDLPNNGEYPNNVCIFT